MLVCACASERGVYARVSRHYQRIMATHRFFFFPKPRWSARLEEHEVRLVGIRAKLDGQELHAVNLDERIRLEWESRMEKLRKSVEETVHQHEENVKQLEGATHRLDEMDEVVWSVIISLWPRVRSVHTKQVT